MVMVIIAGALFRSMGLADVGFFPAYYLGLSLLLLIIGGAYASLNRSPYGTCYRIFTSVFIVLVFLGWIVDFGFRLTREKSPAEAPIQEIADQPGSGAVGEGEGTSEGAGQGGSAGNPEAGSEENSSDRGGASTEPANGIEDAPEGLTGDKSSDPLEETLDDGEKKSDHPLNSE